MIRCRILNIHFLKPITSHLENELKFAPLLATSTNNLTDFLYRFLPKYEKIVGKSGAVVECGVGYGRSALLLIQCAEILKDKCNFFFFDSFEGFPELGPQDLEENGSTPIALKGRWNVIEPRDLARYIQMSMDFDVERSKKVIGRTSIVQGFVEQSLDAEIARIKNSGGIKFLHLDLDLYTGYKVCLEKLYELVVPGGVICFDEYHTGATKKFPGPRRAVIDFFSIHGLNIDEIKLDKTGKAFYFKH